MLRASIFFCVLVAAAGQAGTGECVVGSDGRSTCPGSDQTALLQGRVHLALEAEASSDTQPQYNSGPRPMSSTMLRYFKGWAQGAIKSTLDRIVPDEDWEPVLMDEGAVVDEVEETKESQDAELAKLTASSAVEVMASTAAQDCPEKDVVFLQASMVSSEFRVLEAEPADSNGVRHVLLQNKEGRFQYLASHQLSNGDHRVVVADPPICANENLATLEAEAAPKPVAGNFGGKSTGELGLLKADDPLVKDCVALLVRTVGEDCHKQVTVKVLTASRSVVDGLKVSMHAKVCGSAGCHLHRPECDFEVSSNHSDASFVQQDDLAATNILPEEKLGLAATLALRVPLCDVDTTDGLGKSQGFDVGLLEQYTFGEESYYKGFEHVYDDYPVVAALQGVAIPADLDFRKKYPACYPALPGKKVGTETVRNQGTCGSCWAFAAATATMANLCVSGQSNHAMHDKSDRYEVSVQKILSCKAKGQSANRVKGCNGGNMYQFDVEAATWGLTKERNNLYKCGGGNPKNHFRKKSAGCGAFPWAGECTGQANLNWWWGGSTKVDGENTMMSFLASGQSMYISMAVYENFMQVRDFSIYTATRGMKRGGHAMNCLGYGKEGHTKYWLIQNSWGPNGWGDQGFARIKRGVNLAGIETAAFAPRVWVEGGKEPKCQDAASGSGLSRNGRPPFLSCAKAAKAGYCRWYNGAIAQNCPTACKSCKAFNGKGTKSPPSPKPSPSPRPAQKALTGFKKDMLQQHNLYRCMHNVPLFTWSDAIARNAQKYADSTGGRMKHSSRASRRNVGGFSTLGENLAFGGTSVGGVRRWYAEIKNTNKGLVSSFSGGTGHYTQIVWKSSTGIGCGTSGSLLVCQYGEAGNYQGQFDKQVSGPVKSKASCQSGPGPRPAPRPQPAPAPSPKPVPASCVDRNPTGLKWTCGCRRGKPVHCWQIKRHCKLPHVKRMCCRTCSGAAPQPKPTPVPTPAPRPTPSKPASVGQITRCSFEDAQLPYCKMWSQGSGDQFDWSRGSRTPSSRTGPPRAKDGRNFLYIETSSPRRNGNKAVLRSELVSIGSGASVSFSYHMYGRPGWLKVLVTSQQKSEQLWAQRGNKGNSWKANTVSLKKYAGKDVQIDFVGTKGYGCGSWMGDIAIDNVVLDRGASAKKIPTTPPTSPPTSPPTMAPSSPPTMPPTTMPPKAPTMAPALATTTPAPRPNANPAGLDALKKLTKKVDKLDSKIDKVLKATR